MDFHLDHIPAKPGFTISHHDTVFLSGSCFAENIGTLLKASRFKTLSNPGGILFNPASIHTFLEQLIKNQAPGDKYIVRRGNTYLSYLNHSAVYAQDQADLLQKLKNIHAEALAFLKEADVLVLTFGTAFVYHHLALDEVVANCHKQPDLIFRKRLLTTEEITVSYTELLRSLKQLNPKLRIIFTVSPVKYLRNGLVENNLSKAILTVSIHQIIQQCPDCFYFPAYELVTDDLRDYRFYKKDLAHPNEQAIGYIWQKFSDTYFNEQAKQLNKKIRQLNLALGHRAMIADDRESEQLSSFISRQKEEIEKLLSSS